MKPHLWLIRVIGIIVPRRLRADWRQEWEAELRCRETLLAEWDKLDWRNKLDLLRRSVGAFWDAICLQPRRLEDEMFQDLRFGARMLLKMPGFTLIAVITLALGIGANTVVFSGVYAMLFEPLPYLNSEQLAVVSQVGRQEVDFGISYPDFTDWKERNAAFERMAAWRGINVNLTSGDEVKRVAGSRISTDFFQLLGGRAQLGRVFLAEEFRPGADKVVILSHKLWQERFGADAGVIGRTLKLDDQSYTVVGVMPMSFLYPFRSVLWAPLEAEEEAGTLEDATANHYQIIGALKQGVSLEGGASADPRRRRLSGILVAAEVALAVALLTGSGLMIRTVLNLTNEDPGFNPKNAGALSLSLPPSNREEKDRRPDHEVLASYFDEAIRRIRALPGVESVGAVTYPPLVGYNPGADFTIDGRASSPQRADIQPITPEYFQAIGIPLLRGRQFTEAEMKPQPEAAIVNNAFAKKFWPDEDPLGKYILLQGDKMLRGPLVVVGVVGDVKQFGLDTDPRPEIYLPMRRRSMTLIVRTSGNPARWAAPVREAVQSLDNRATISMRTLEQMINRSTFSRRNLASLMGVLGTVALLLAAMGIYGVISYLVSQRTREMGIRLALGAQKRDLLQLVLGQGLTLTMIGVAAGLALALALTRFLSSMLFGVSAADPITFAAIALLLAVVALIASYLPARCAMKVDPITALRRE